ncbi:MAG TPA: YifB family Mg chelatase-like AAA ATPase [Rectinemataceae bacterium]|nr:YifB family Mg chelatase-like AAA ATPase [Rectinemataceae bacterium]
MDIFAYEPLGFEGFLVKIEVDIRRGIPAVDIVGLAAASVRESRERVRAAIRNSAFEFPQDRILINLSPADLPKEGSLYDLPIALKILLASGAVPDGGKGVLAIGELTLDGFVGPVRGTLPALLQASRKGVRDFIVPEANYAEAGRLREGRLFPIGHISEIPDILLSIRDGSSFRPAPQQRRSYVDFSSDAGDGPCLDFSDYRGNEKVMRALVVAAAGRHNLLLFGPPGSGKTMAAMRFPSLLPALSEPQALEVAAIWSLHGKSYGVKSSAFRPPVCSPHHSASLEGIVGGGKPPRPGEISLAHRGVLFLDETPEFGHDVLQSLREPLERGSISVVRAGRVLRYPADFQLLMAANSCPCGNLGSPTKACVCSPLEIQRYWKKLGGPLLDRIDMRIPVLIPDAAAMLGAPCHCQADLVFEVEEAARLQLERTAAFGGLYNSRLQPEMVKRFCVLDAGADRLFRSRAEELGFSMRACHSVLKVARTIADLQGSSAIEEHMLAEAAGYREYGDGDSYWPF